MKQAAGWAGSWLLLGAGHLLLLSLRFTGVLYTPYNQRWGGLYRCKTGVALGPWKRPPKE